MSECIIWTGPKNNHGYGQTQYEKKQVFVHRLAYCQANGLSLQDISGKSVMHSCDNPACHNPEHLSLGSHLDNMRDMVSKGRNRPASLPGEKNPAAVLTEADVKEIRRVFTGARGELAALARKHGVEYQTISKIVKRTTWQHL